MPSNEFANDAHLKDPINLCLPVEACRDRFPALTHGQVFFDNGGGSQTLDSVADRISDYLLTSNVQLGATYASSVLASERVISAEAALARLVNAKHAEEVVLGPSATRLLQDLARAMAPSLVPGDEIVITNFDHEANIGPWIELSKQGVQIKSWCLDKDNLELDMAELDRLITPRTRLVCFTHVSNIIGTIWPIHELVDLVHARGAKVCVDGVAYAPHRRIDVQAWNVDFYVISFYKVFGPHQALLYARKDLLLELASINHFFYSSEAIPRKMQPGNVNYELAHGSAAIVDYLEDIGRRLEKGATAAPANWLEIAFQAIAEHEEQLSSRLLEFLNHCPRVRVIGDNSGDREKRVPTISFVANHRSSKKIVSSVDPTGVGIRYGDFFSRRLIEALGLTKNEGVVRVSMVHYNTVAEVDQLIDGLSEQL